MRSYLKCEQNSTCKAVGYSLGWERASHYQLPSSIFSQFFCYLNHAKRDSNCLFHKQLTAYKLGQNSTVYECMYNTDSYA